MPIIQGVEGEILPSYATVPIEEPTEYVTWPWPLNYLQDFIVESFAWVGDSINFVGQEIGRSLVDMFEDLGTDITDFGDWLNEQTALAIRATQDAIETTLLRVQGEMNTAILTSQGFFEERMLSLQTTAGNIGKGIEDLGNVAIPTLQLTLGLAIQQNVQKTERNREVIETIDEKVLRKVGPVLLTFVSDLVNPFLKKLNDSLEGI